LLSSTSCIKHLLQQDPFVQIVTLLPMQWVQGLIKWSNQYSKPREPTSLIRYFAVYTFLLA
jgi:hypothetical protein